MSQFSAGKKDEQEGSAGGVPQGAEGERRHIAGGASTRAGVPDPELAPRATRRRFTAAYKLKIVLAAEACGPGEIGALLRREGLYSSLLTEWRRARDSGALGALEPRQRGPKPPSAEQVQLAEARRELERSQADLVIARRVIEVQGNVSALLEELLAKSAPDPTDEQPPTS